MLERILSLGVNSSLCLLRNFAALLKPMVESTLGTRDALFSFSIESLFSRRFGLRPTPKFPATGE